MLYLKISKQIVKFDYLLLLTKQFLLAFLIQLMFLLERSNCQTSCLPDTVPFAHSRSDCKQNEHIRNVYPATLFGLVSVLIQSDMSYVLFSRLQIYYFYTKYASFCKSFYPKTELLQKKLASLCLKNHSTFLQIIQSITYKVSRLQPTEPIGISGFYAPLYKTSPEIS